MAKVSKTDPRGGHVRLYWDVIDSHAWRALSGTEIALYIALRRQLKGSNNGNISATLSVLRHSGFRSSATLAKSLRALQTVGLIAKTRDTGGLTHGGAICCLYRFTDESTLAMPAKAISATRPTKDYLAWRSKDQAMRAVADAHEAAKRPGHPNAARPSRTALGEKVKLQ